MRKKLISIDFDGVLNSYVSGWIGPADTPDDPVPGAMKFLADLVADDRFDAVVYSSRCASEEGVNAIRTWLDRHLVAELGEHAGRYVGNRIRVASSKPPAFVAIDDRVICFDGTWPSLDAVAAFVPWNKKPVAVLPIPGDMNPDGSYGRIVSPHHAVAAIADEIERRFGWRPKVRVTEEGRFAVYHVRLPDGGWLKNAQDFSALYLDFDGVIAEFVDQFEKMNRVKDDSVFGLVRIRAVEATLRRLVDLLNDQPDVAIARVHRAGVDGFSIVCTAGMGAAFLPIATAAEMTSTALMRFVADFSDARAERMAA